MLAYEVASDLIGEYLRVCETTCLDSMHKFHKVVNVVFSEVYLREPNVSLTCQVPTMTSTCSSALRYSLGLWKANALVVNYEINGHA
jgi:hypothetical protein